MSRPPCEVRLNIPHAHPSQRCVLERGHRGPHELASGETFDLWAPGARCPLCGWLKSQGVSCRRAACEGGRRHERA